MKPKHEVRGSEGKGKMASECCRPMPVQFRIAGSFIGGMIVAALGHVAMNHPQRAYWMCFVAYFIGVLWGVVRGS